MAQMRGCLKRRREANVRLLRVFRLNKLSCPRKLNLAQRVGHIKTLDEPLAGTFLNESKVAHPSDLRI